MKEIPPSFRAIMASWLRKYAFTDSRPHFERRFFAFLRAILKSKRLTTNEIDPQTNGQTERFNRAVISQMRHFARKNQTKVNIYRLWRPGSSVSCNRKQTGPLSVMYRVASVISRKLSFQLICWTDLALQAWYNARKDHHTEKIARHGCKWRKRAYSQVKLRAVLWLFCYTFLSFWGYDMVFIEITQTQISFYQNLA